MAAKFCIVSAFVDIGREKWSGFQRSNAKYLNDFKPHLKLGVPMIVFVDESLYDELKEFENNQVKFIKINEQFLSDNIWAFSRLPREKEIMESSSFKQIMRHRASYPEVCNPSYNIVQHAKIDFLNYVIDNRLIDYDDQTIIAWSDFGYFGASGLFPDSTEKMIQGIVDNVDRDRMNIMAIDPPCEKDFDVYHTLVTADERLCGFFSCGTPKSLKSYQELYHRVLDDTFHKRNIVDDDQHLMLQCLHQNPELIKVWLLPGWHQTYRFFEKLNDSFKKTIGDSGFLQRLENAAGSITPLGKMFEREGSDKSGLSRNWHNYDLVYYELFKYKRNQKFRVFELGLGTNNESFPSNMTRFGIPGASHRAWAHWFFNGEVYGADIDAGVLFSTEPSINRAPIKTYFCDQTRAEVIKKMWMQIDGLFDVIVDDGLHQFHANACFFENSIHKLKDDGIYIIEDIETKYVPQFLNIIEKEWKVKWPQREFDLITLPHQRNNCDNRLLLIY